jgi:hypothetical protein
MPRFGAQSVESGGRAQLGAERPGHRVTDRRQGRADRKAGGQADAEQVAGAGQVVKEGSPLPPVVDRLGAQQPLRYQRHTDAQGESGTPADQGDDRRPAGPGEKSSPARR